MHTATFISSYYNNSLLPHFEHQTQILLFTKILDYVEIIFDECVRVRKFAVLNIIKKNSREIIFYF